MTVFAVMENILCLRYKLLMTPERFVEALNCVHWTSGHVAQLLGCSEELVDAWASGKEDIPPQIGVWLERLAEAHEAVGVPTTFRGRRS